MCLSPLHVNNPTKPQYRVAGYTSPVLVVPCGRCNECRMHKQDNWFVRLYSEWLFCKETGGDAFFFTTTYNESNLPHCTRYNLPCFKRSDVQNYFKRVRKHLSDHNIDIDFRYFVTCEYGDEKHRPHYHFVIYTYKPCDIHALIRLFQSKWHHGISYTSDINNGIIIDARGLSYVSKYTSKNVYEDDYYHEWRKLLRPCRTTYENKSSDYWQFEKGRPFTQTSREFGLHAFDRLPDGSYKYPFFHDEDIEQGYVMLPDIKDGYKKYKLPLYLERRFFFQYHVVDDTIHYALNERGKDVYIKRLESRISSTKQRFDIITSLRGKEFDDVFRSYGTTAEDFSLLYNTHCNHDWFLQYLIYSPYKKHSPDDHAFSTFNPAQTFLDAVASITFDPYVTPLDDYSPHDGASYSDIFSSFLDNAVQWLDLSNNAFICSILDDLCYIYSCGLSAERIEQEKVATRLKILKRRLRRSRQCASR